MRNMSNFRLICWAILLLLSFAPTIGGKERIKDSITVPPFNDFYFIKIDANKTQLITVNIRNVYLFNYHRERIELEKHFRFDVPVKIVFLDTNTKRIYVNTGKELLLIGKNNSLEKLMEFPGDGQHFSTPKITVSNDYANHILCFDGQDIRFKSQENEKMPNINYTHFSYSVLPFSNSGFKLDFSLEESRFYHFALPRSSSMTTVSPISSEDFCFNVSSLYRFNPLNFKDLEYYSLSLGNGFKVKFKIIPPFSDRLTFFPKFQVVCTSPVKKIFRTIYHDKLFPIADLDNDGILDILIIYSPFGLGAKDELESLAMSKKITLHFSPFLTGKEDFIRSRAFLYKINYEIFFSDSIFANVLPGKLKSLVFIGKKRVRVYSLTQKQEEAVQLQKSGLNVVRVGDVNGNGQDEILIGDRHENKIYIYHF